jgi:hypothetical protein
MRLLNGRKRDGYVAKSEMATYVRESVGFHGIKNNFGRLTVPFPRVLSRNAKEREFKRAGPRPDPKIDSARAELIEHAYFFKGAQGMIQIQQHHQGSHPQSSGALRDSG